MEIIEELAHSDPHPSFLERRLYPLFRCHVDLRSALPSFLEKVMLVLEISQFVAVGFCSLVSCGGFNTFLGAVPILRLYGR